MRGHPSQGAAHGGPLTLTSPHGPHHLWGLPASLSSGPPHGGACPPGGDIDLATLPLYVLDSPALASASAPAGGINFPQPMHNPISTGTGNANRLLSVPG